jgi:hypothetical protein
MANNPNDARTRASSIGRIVSVFLLLAGLLAVFATRAEAVHDDGIFELDGNATNETKANPIFDGDDWDVIYANRADECGSISGGPISVCSFSHDAVNGSIFTGGGSKDEQEVETSWQHTDGAVPAKDDLLDAFAAQYDNGHLYFGADRYATNGDAQIGFWFFHDEISENADGSFSGFHTAHDDNGTPADLTDDENGDILVLSNFSNGGTVPNIRVFEWYGVDDVRLLPGVPLSSLCSPALSGDEACAITSGNGVASPWPFDPKSGPDNIFSSGAFYEGGIDLEELGFGDDCFSSFLAETRSSTSITATLKDYVLGGFGDCGANVTTQVSSTSVSIGTGSVNVSDTASILGTGSGTPPNPTGTVDFYLCGPEDGITSCDTSGELVAENVGLSDANPAIALSGDVAVTEVGDYCFFADYSGDDNYPAGGDDGTNECFTVTPAQPAITTTAVAGPVDLGDPISDVAHLSGTATDPDGSAADGTITFNLYGPDDATCSGAAVFTSTATVSGDGDYNSGDFTPTAPGVYRWIASYDGDSPNTLGVSGACNDEGEASTVNQDQPTLTTNQSWTPQDSTTIVAPAGGALSGTASFALYESADCSGVAVYSQNVAVSGATPQTVSTTNPGSSGGGYTGSASGTTNYSWQVSYDSDNGGQADIPASCVEVTTLTIDNDNSN